MPFQRPVTLTLSMCLWVMTTLAAASAFAAEEEAQATDRIAVGRARLDSIPLSITPEAPGSFILPYRLTNTSNRALTFETIEASYLVAPESGTSGSFNCKDVAIEIPPGGELFLICEYTSNAQKGGVFKLWTDWQVLTLTPATYQVFARAKLRDEGALVSVSSITLLSLRPTIWQVIWGVAVGAIFLALYRGAREATGANSWRARTTSFFRNIIPFWISAWISGSIVVFITFRMQDAGFPITIAVNDFYGGIVIGIFGYVAAAWVGEKLLSASPATGSSQTGPSAPVDGSINEPDAGSNPEHETAMAR